MGCWQHCCLVYTHSRLLQAAADNTKAAGDMQKELAAYQEELAAAQPPKTPEETQLLLDGAPTKTILV